MRINRALVVFLLCAISGTATADRDNKFYIASRGRFYPQAMAYFKSGTELLDKGDVQGARQCFDAAIKIDKNIWPVYLDRALIFARAGKWDLALQDCNAAAHLQPHFYRTFVIRADVNNALGRCRESLADLDKVISLHANAETDALALSHRAWLRTTCRDASVRDPKQALADARKACELDGWKKATYLSIFAAACAADGDFDGAVRYQRQAIKSGKYTPDEQGAAERRLSAYEHRKR